MYYALIEQFKKTLQNLEVILAKAETYATVRKFNPDNFLELRLAPDMLPFSRQVQIACDSAKFAAARVSGKEAPKFEDDEKTITALRERILSTVKYLDQFSNADFSAVDDAKRIPIPFPQGKAMETRDFLLSRSLPNFFFHTSIAYALLRSAGVEVGKTDFLGELKIFDA